MPESVARTKSRQSRARVAANAEAVAKVNEATAAATDRIERLNLARQEREAVKAWMAAGSQGDRPVTPNLDAIEAHEPIVKGARQPRTIRTIRGQQARAVAKGGKRGPGKRVSDAELAAYVAGVKATFPGANVSDELEVAYWIEKLAVTRTRFFAAWVNTEAAAPAKPARRTRKAS